MSADSPRRTIRGVPAIVPPQVVSDRSIIDSVAGFINDVTLTNQPQGDPKDTIIWARFETTADISDPTYGDDWEIDGNVAPPLLLILGYGLGIQVWAIPANGEAVEVLSWRHGNITALRVLPKPLSIDDEMTDEPCDNYADKRPLMAICEGVPLQSHLSSHQTPSLTQQQYCSVNFISLKTGAQVKTIKFKNNVLDILANRTSVVIIFPERIAVFDARTLDDRLSVTTCYPSPGINPNPVALGSRWMAYSENRLFHTKRSGGGCDGDGVASYTATVLNAAKSLGKGLRELGEQMAAGLTGTTSSGNMSSKASSFDSVTGDIKQPGVITILDIKHAIKNISPTTGTPVSVNGSDPIIAHFIAHSDAIVAMEFDNSGMLLLTADKRGHDFHLFRIQPHPAGAHLASVHHLYILHRGDTSAKVQNISFSLDSRWVAVSTLRGTTHVFPITPYGGPYGVRTHASLHVVNKLSRFHRSAGLSADNRSSSPISHSDSMSFNQISMPYNNPTMPPFPRPHIILPLAQLRQPSVLGSPPGSAQNLSYQKSSVSSAASAAAAGRQRLSSLSDDNGKPLSVCAVFAKARSWLLDPPNIAREGPAHKMQRKAVDSLFIMAGHGALIQYDLDTKLASNVAKEKICDDTAIELEVEAKAQWNLGRKDSSIEIQPPLTSDNWLIKERNSSINLDHHSNIDDNDDRSDRWLSQVEIITHAGPHRRLWMGPQFVFKTYNTPSGSNLSHIDAEAVEIGVSTSIGGSGNCGNINRPGRSSPMNMPLANPGRSAMPVLIESGSYSSIEQSPKLMDRFKHDHLDSDFTMTHGESRLKEDLADAMRESPSVQHKDTGIITPTTTVCSRNKSRQIATTSTSNLGKNSTETYSLSTDYQQRSYNDGKKSTSHYTTELSTYGGEAVSAGGDEIQQTEQRSNILIEKVVNPLGTVTTIARSPSENEFELNNPYGIDYNPDDYIIHENCDESLFRPVVTIFCDDFKQLNKNNDGDGGERTSEKSLGFGKKGTLGCRTAGSYDGSSSSNKNLDQCGFDEQPPEPIGTKLIVPVIEKQKSKNRDFSSDVNKKPGTNELSKHNNEEMKTSMNNKIKNNKKLNKIELKEEISSLENKNYNSSKTVSKSLTSSVDQVLSEKVDRKYVSRKSEELKMNENSIETNVKVYKKSEELEVDESAPSTTITLKNNRKKYDDKNSSKKEQAESLASIVSSAKNRKSEEKEMKSSYHSKANRKSEEKELKKSFEKTTGKAQMKSIDSTDSAEIIKIRLEEKPTIETSNVEIQRKSSKDEDSESFESLETIDANIDFINDEKSPSRKSINKTPDEFEIIEKNKSDKKITNTTTTTIDNEQTKNIEKYNISNKSSFSYSDKIKQNQIQSDSEQTTIVEPIQLPITKLSKKNQKIEVKKSIDEEMSSCSNNIVDDLKFYDKFTKDDNLSINTKPTESIRPVKDSMQIDLDFPCLSNKLSKKQKFATDSLRKLTPPSAVVEQQQEKSLKDVLLLAETNVKKSITDTGNNVSIENTEINQSSNVNTTTTVTFTLPMKKRSNKKSSNTDESMKKSNEKQILKESISSSASVNQNQGVIKNVTAVENVANKEITSKSTKKNLKIKSKDFLQQLDFDISTSTTSTTTAPTVARSTTGKKITSTDIEEFSDTTIFLPPLSPLEPFDKTFDDHFQLIDKRQINNKTKSGENFSLINFESPELEEHKNSISSGKNSSTIDIKADDDNSDDDYKSEAKSIKPAERNLNKFGGKSKGFPENNIIFALCGSLHYENENQKQNMDDSSNNSPIILSHDSDELCSKVLNLTTTTTATTTTTSESDEPQQYISLDPIFTSTKSQHQKNHYHHRASKSHQRHSRDNSKIKGIGILSDNTAHSTTPSSSETEESSATISFKLKKNQNQKIILNTSSIGDDDDEELRPLISACSMTSSISGIPSETGTVATTATVSSSSSSSLTTTTTKSNNKINKKLKKNLSGETNNPTTSSTIALEISNAIIDSYATITLPQLNTDVITATISPIQTATTTSDSAASSSSEQANNTSEEQGTDESDEQQQVNLTKLKKFKNSEQLVADNGNCSKPSGQINDNDGNIDKSIGRGNLSTSSAMNSNGNSSGSGSGGGGGVAGQQQQQNAKKKPKRKKR